MTEPIKIKGSYVLRFKEGDPDVEVDRTHRPATDESIRLRLAHTRLTAEMVAQAGDRLDRLHSLAAGGRQAAA